MESIKIFLDHFYFSLVCAAVGLFIIYVLFSVLGADFPVSDHMLAAVGTWLTVAASVASLLTYRTIRSRKRPPIAYTRRQT